MNGKKAKGLRKIAKSFGGDTLTHYKEKKTVKKILTHDLDEQGNRIEKYVERITRLIYASCTRHKYQYLKRIG